MPSQWYTIVIDSADPASLAGWWAQVLGYQVLYSAPDQVVVAKDDHSYPGLIFVPVPEGKQVKNRLHIDLNPHDQEAEVKRLIEMGATRADVGQGDSPWAVLADPEGNEFCVLTPRPQN